MNNCFEIIATKWSRLGRLDNNDWTWLIWANDTDKGWPAVRLAVVPKIGMSLVLLLLWSRRYGYACYYWRHAYPHLPDPNSKRLRKILNLGTTASLPASSPLISPWYKVETRSHAVHPQPSGNVQMKGPQSLSKPAGWDVTAINLDCWSNLFDLRNHAQVKALLDWIIMCLHISDSNPYSGVELNSWTFQWDLTFYPTFA